MNDCEVKLTILSTGKQALKAGRQSELQRGVSITDACISFERTETVLKQLAEAVRMRRNRDF